MPTRAPSLETLFQALLLVLGAVIAYVAWGYGFGSLAQPGPGLYPFFLGVVIVACAAVLLVAQRGAPGDSALPDRRSLRIIAVMTLTFCAWILAMPLLGYVLVTFAAALAFCKTLGLEGWRKPLAVSGATALFVYLLFGYALFIDLPRGILFE